MAINEERIAELMKSLDITRAEAIELMEDDDDIDHDKPKEFDLTPEQMKVAKKMKNAGRAVDAFGKKRVVERPPNEIKRTIIAELGKAVGQIEGATDITISNVERFIDFKMGGMDYTIMLTEHRPNKKKKGTA
jgi:hypothetical protein